PLFAVDYPLVAALLRAAREDLRIGAALRLGHRVTRANLVVEQRPQVLILLRRRTVVREDLGVTGIGCLAAEHDRCALRTPENLVHQRELELTVTLPSEVRTEVTRPETPLLHLRLQRRDQLLSGWGAVNRLVGGGLGERSAC